MKIQVTISITDISEKGKEQSKTITLEGPDLPGEAVIRIVKENLSEAYRLATGSAQY